jgi:hypothetical protein
MGRFVRLEKEKVILNIERVRGAFSAQLNALDSKTGDWRRCFVCVQSQIGAERERGRKASSPESENRSWSREQAQ